MASRVQKANKIIDRIQSAVGLSEDGKNWLIGSLDPMHDEKILCAGFPDREQGASVVQVIKRSMTLRKPAGLAAGPWKVSVILDNDLTSWDYELHLIWGSLCRFVTPASLPMGGLTVVYSPDDGITAFPYFGGLAINGPELTIPPEYSGSKLRLIGAGFEAVNTTPELYKSGSIAVWEQPTSNVATSIFTSYDPTIYFMTPQVNVTDTLPPTHLADAMLLQGSQQWNASEGAYCVATMSTLNNCPKYLDTVGHCFINDMENPIQSEPQTGVNGYIRLQTGPNPPFMAPSVHCLTPFNRKGMYISGLSDQSTFTLNYNIIIEVFPAQTSTLITLATPSPCEDPLATQLYSLITCRLPVGVRFSDNDLGDFFLGIADTIANVVGNIARPIAMASQGWVDQRARDNARRDQAASTWTTSGRTSKQERPAPKPAQAKPLAIKYKPRPATAKQQPKRK